MGKIILAVLIVVVVAAGATYGGYRMGDSAGFERANQVRQQFFQQRQTGQGGASNFSGGQSGAGSFGSSGGGGNRSFELQGTVKSIDGDTLTITLGNRDIQVKLSNTTQILKSVTSTRADLTAGARVMVTPETGNGGGGTGAGNGGGTGGGAGGTLNAASVTILPPQ